MLQRQLIISDRGLLESHSLTDSFGRLELLVPDSADKQTRLAASVASKAGGSLRVTGNHFDLLGYRGLDFGSPVDWHFEPTISKRSPLRHWKLLDNLDASLTGNKKVVWELNRHQFLVCWALGYLSEADEKQATHVCDSINDWIAANPVGKGINWVSSLELGFRALSWLWACALIRESSAWARQDKRRIVRSLADHAGHVARHLSLYSSPNTHLTGEALALYAIGTMLPQLQHSQKWRELGRATLLRELAKQVLPDGVYFERASWYQRYTLDFCIQFRLLAERSGDLLPDFVNARTEMLAEHLMWITRPNGTSPYLGDDDGGKLWNWGSSAPDDWRSSLGTCALLFGRPDFLFVSGRIGEETILLLGPGALERAKCLQPQAPATLSKAFFDGGYFVMRSGWRHDANYLLFDCGPHGAMNCGHAHSDALAIEVAALGQTFLIDPGTFTYSADSPDRDRFRHSAMHNTLTVNGESASVSAGAFKWSHVSRQSLTCWHDHRDFSFVGGWADGFMRLADPVKHRRQVFFPMREYWVVVDQLEKRLAHSCKLHFHWPHEVESNLRTDSRGVSLVRSGVALDIYSEVASGHWAVEDSWVSPIFGKKIDSRAAVLSFEVSNDAECTTLLLPRKESDAPPAIAHIGGDSGKGLRLTFENFEDFILRRVTSCAESGLDSADCEWLWQRKRSKSGIFDRLIGMHGRHISCCGFEVTCAEGFRYLVASVHENSLKVSVAGAGAVSLSVPQFITKIELNGRPIELTESPMLFEMTNLSTDPDQQDCCDYVRN